MLTINVFLPSGINVNLAIHNTIQVITTFLSLAGFENIALSSLPGGL